MRLQDHYPTSLKILQLIDNYTIYILLNTEWSESYFGFDKNKKIKEEEEEKGKKILDVLCSISHIMSIRKGAYILLDRAKKRGWKTNKRGRESM